MTAVAGTSAAPAGAARAASAPVWPRRPLARATGWLAVPIALLLLVSASPPGTYLPFAFAAGFFALLLAVPWLYALLSALSRGRRGLGARLLPCLVAPALVVLAASALASERYDRVAFALSRSALEASAATAAALPADRARLDVDRVGLYAVSEARCYGTSGALVRIEVALTRTRERASGLVRADASGLAQLARIDPEVETWPLGGDWHGYRGSVLSDER